VYAGECSLFVAEQFTLEQIVRDGSAIYHDKRIVLSLTVSMNRLSNNFLAGAAFAAN
jgi:hypothetical protein